MLFNSYLFIFLFVPVTLAVYLLLGRLKYLRLSVVWLVLASLAFYGWYNPVYVLLILGSILFNYALGMNIGRSIRVRRKVLLASGIAANILLLGYFKYANFFIGNVNSVFGSKTYFDIVLPLAISFFTIQQIAYLVDVYRGEVKRHGILDYCLFVTFFPKLISGPIVRWREFFPQIVRTVPYRITADNTVIGLMVFFMGLFKKVILADHVGSIAAPVFDSAAGTTISFFNSWSAALAYTFQLYFDFSGYTDMAIGLGLLFGIKLPLNFWSPYKAVSIIDFWRRWHITLCRFLRDYLYIPLGGNRRGFAHQALNILMVMTIAGIWHGAGWTFILWGFLHGSYLVINHGWRRIRKRLGFKAGENTLWGNALSILITFIAVTAAWVFFRADNVASAMDIIEGMMGLNGFSLAVPGFSIRAVVFILVSLAVCWFLPDVQEYMADHRPSLDTFGQVKRGWLRWKPSLLAATIMAGITVLAILGLTQASKFLYFQF